MYFRFISILIFAAFVSHLSYSGEITFLTHSVEGKSYRDENGELRGLEHSGRRAFQLELIREMMLMRHYSPKNIHIIPFPRALAMIVANSMPHALFNAGKRPNRMGRMKFVGPLTLDTYYLYEQKASPSGVNTIEGAKKVGVCVHRGGNQDKFVTKNGFEKIIRNTYDGCFKMLLANRDVDLVSISATDLQGVLKQANIDPDLIQKSPISLFSSEGSLVFSNQISDEEIDKWQEVLDQLKASGKYDELTKTYLFQDTPPPS